MKETIAIHSDKELMKEIEIGLKTLKGGKECLYTLKEFFPVKHIKKKIESR